MSDTEIKVPEVQTCGRRMETLGPWKFGPGLDHWRVEPNGDRTCSFCGSLHPEDFIAIAELYAAGVEGVRFDVTSKSYKRYASRPGVQNAMQGGIKFYAAHIPDDPVLAEKLREADRAARDAYRKRWPAC